MALYRDDDGNIYWSDRLDPVIQPPSDPAKTVPFAQPRLIHPHKLPRLAGVSLGLSITSLLLAAVSLSLLLLGDRALSAVVGCVAFLVICGGQPLVLNRMGRRTAIGTPLRLMAGQPVGPVMMDIVNRLGFAFFVGSTGANLLAGDPERLWWQVYAAMAALMIVLLIGQVLLRLRGLYRASRAAGQASRA